MRMNLSVDEIKWLILACANHEYTSVSSCEIGLKLISHLPLAMQEDFKNYARDFRIDLADIESMHMIGYEEELWIAQHYMK